MFADFKFILIGFHTPYVSHPLGFTPPVLLRFTDLLHDSTQCIPKDDQLLCYFEHSVEKETIGGTQSV